MKKIAAVLIALALLTAPGCGKVRPADTSGEGLVVYVSIYPLYDFTCKVAGDRATVTALVSGGAEPHEWEPTPADRAGLERADVFVYNGLGMEHWVDKVLTAMENPPLIVEASSSVETLGSVGEEDGHDHSGGDPHTWLSPLNAKREMELIKDAMAQADPGNAAYYQQNYEQYAAQFDALDEEYRAALEGLPGRQIVVAHQAFGYLCRDYGLKQVAVRGFSTDGEPDPAGMTETIEFVKNNNIKVIFFEQSASSQVAETIARETGAQTDVLNPIEFLSAEEEAAGEDYFSLMRKNLAALERALG